MANLDTIIAGAFREESPAGYAVGPPDSVLEKKRSFVSSRHDQR